MDGLAVTASVWEEAHEYHRQRQRYHNLLLHKSGIVFGLEVVASDPPDSSVYILPGAAVDPEGEVVLVTEPVNFDFGASTGKLYLLLTYGESRPMQDEDDGPAYITSQFSIESATSLGKDVPCTILAEITRERGAAIQNAADKEFPGINEIDLRFRQGCTGHGKPEGIHRVAVCYAGSPLEGTSAHGAGSLARALRNVGKHVWVDDRVPLTSNLEAYSLVYLVGRKDAPLNRDEMNAIYAYLQQAGTVFIENCTKDQGDELSGIDAFYQELAASYGIQLEEVRRGHPLMGEPHLFTILPGRDESGSSANLLAGGGLIVSSLDLGCLWRGERGGTPVPREEIRNAVEFGENILRYAEERRSQANTG